MNIPAGFEVLPKDVLRIIISFCPHDCWNLNKYFRALSYEVLPLEEKQQALDHAAKRGYLEMLINLLVIITVL